MAIYLSSARHRFPAAAPLLLKEAQNNSKPGAMLEAFEFFGEEARPAIPLMVALLKNDGMHRGNMMALFRRLGPAASEAAPDIAEVLGHDNAEIIVGALEALKSIGPASRLAAPKIQPLLTNRDPCIRMLAAATIAHLENRAEPALPVLLAGLDGQLPGVAKACLHVDMRQDLAGLVINGPDAAAMLIGQFGPAARSALPALEDRLADASEWIRLSAAQAVWRVSGDARKALPVILAILNSKAAADRYLLIRTIEAIEDMGPAAKEAIPALARVRSVSMTARHAVNAAEDRINH